MNNLRYYRQQHHASFEALAKACQIHYSRLKILERGQTPTTVECAQLCIYLQISPRELLPQDRSVWPEVETLVMAITKERDRTKEKESELQLLRENVSHEKRAEERVLSEARERELKVLLQRTETLRQQYDEEQSATFRKELEIPREYFNAATTILQGFIQTLKSQQGDEEIISASIRQQEEKLILIVRTRSGLKATVEESFMRYGAVVLQNAPIESITSDPFLIFELRHQLELARLQLRTQQELNQIRESNHETRIRDLEKREEWMQKQIGFSMSSSAQELIEAIRTLGAKSEVAKVLIQLQESLKRPEAKEQSKSLLKRAGERVVTDGIAPGAASTIAKLIEKLNEMIGLG